MLDQIKKINQDAKNDQQKVTTAQELDELRLKYLSRKGIISSLFSELKNVEASERGIVGQKINQLKNDEKLLQFIFGRGGNSCTICLCYSYKGETFKEEFNATCSQSPS